MNTPLGARKFAPFASLRECNYYSCYYSYQHVLLVCVRACQMREPERAHARLLVAADACACACTCHSQTRASGERAAL